MLIAGETLKVYNTIFSKLLEKTKDQATKKNLNYLKSRTEELRNVYFSDSQKQLEILTHVLEELKTINVSRRTKSSFQYSILTLFWYINISALWQYK